MKLFENYNTAKQKYGKELVDRMCHVGIPPQYLLAACKFNKNGVKLEDLRRYFRQWMTYVTKNKKDIDVNRLNFDEFYSTIQKFKSAYGIPNKIYDDGQVSIGKISSAKDIARFPIKNEWCIIQPQMFKKYMAQGYTFYIIDTKDESDYVRYVIMMVGSNGKKYFYDLDNSEMTNDSISDFQSHLTHNAILFINNNLKENITMKKTIRLNERELHRLISESVKRVLKESKTEIFTIEGFNHTQNELIEYPLNLFGTDYETIDAACEAAEEAAKYWKDETDDIDIFVMAGEYRLDSGAIYGEPDAVGCCNNHKGWKK